MSELQAKLKKHEWKETEGFLMWYM